MKRKMKRPAVLGALLGDLLLSTGLLAQTNLSIGTGSDGSSKASGSSYAMSGTAT